MSRRAIEVRSARKLWAAAGSSHDGVIRTLRIALPIGIVVLVFLLAFAPMTVGRDISFVLSKDRVEVAKERLRVTAAQYSGEDSNGQAFQLRAGSAVQVSSRDPVVKLNDLLANIQLRDGPATMRAKTGRYDMEKEKVAIDGVVKLDTADGYHIQTRDVGLDMKTRMMASTAPVEGTMPLGTFSAGRLSADLNERIVVLDRGARLHIVQSQARGTP